MADGSGFTSAVWSQKAKNFSLVHLKRQIKNPFAAPWSQVRCETAITLINIPPDKMPNAKAKTFGTAVLKFIPAAGVPFPV